MAVAYSSVAAMVHAAAGGVYIHEPTHPAMLPDMHGDPGQRVGCVLVLVCVAGLLILFLTTGEDVLPAYATLTWFACAAFAL